MVVIASHVVPGHTMDHDFVVPQDLIEPVMDPRRPERLERRRIKLEFIDWCEHNLVAFTLYMEGCEFRVRVCIDDYILLRLKYNIIKEKP